jgi:nitrogen-specific signal transduction histidine kinase
VNIHRILDDVIELVEMDPLGARVAVRRFYDPSIPEMLADADRLTQVFLNLARNALQAMEGREGRLTITTRMGFDHRVSAASGDQGAPLVVEIADTGPGISPEDLEQLAIPFFSTRPGPFFSTRPGGTGLGLALSRHWVARHGGSLRIRSTPGEGTSVRVSLPLRTPS